MADKKVDESWKKQAKEEKERLAKEPEGNQPQLTPEASLPLIISSFFTQALIALGEMENPIDGSRARDLEAAKFSIDLLQVLSDKTKGNLTEDEEKLLDSALYDLRMRYVQASS